jgi:hypothetical protein
VGLSPYDDSYSFAGSKARKIPQSDCNRQQHYGLNHPENSVSIANEVGMESHARFVLLVI